MEEREKEKNNVREGKKGKPASKKERRKERGNGARASKNFMETREKREIIKGQRKERCRERRRTSRKPVSLILSFFFFFKVQTYSLRV